MSKEAYTESLAKIHKEVEFKMVKFLAKLPIFNGFSLSTVQSMYWKLEKVKYTRGMVVFDKGSTVKHMYIVYKGLFEMDHKLPV